MSLSGFKELEASLRELKDRATSRRVATRALTAAAQPIVARAQQLAPDDPETGMGNFLRESIKVGKAGNKARGDTNTGQNVTVFIGIDGSVKPPQPSTRRKTKKGTAKTGGGVAAYSIFTEMGTGTHQAQPFMRPAFEELKVAAIDDVAVVLREEIAKTKARAARKAVKVAK